MTKLGAALLPAHRAPATWAVLAASVLPLPLLLALLWPFMHFVWTDRAAYSHGYLVLGVAVWLAYRAWRSVDAPRIAPSWFGTAALAATVGAAVAGSAADVALLPQLAIPVLPLATIWAIAGGSVMRRFFAACAYLVFALPVWDPLNEPLRRLTAIVAGELTRQSSIPAFIDGDTIRIPAGAFVVEGGCSGLHYLIVACALSTFYVLLAYERWQPRVIGVLVAVLAAIVANWVRVFVVIVAGHLTDMQHYLVTVDHYTFGWVLFFVFLAPLLFVARRLEHRTTISTPVRLPGDKAERTGLRLGKAVTPIALACAVVLWGGVMLAYQAMNRPIGAGSTGHAFALPDTLGPWLIAGDWDSSSRPRFDNADDVASASYRLSTSGSVVDVFLAHYGVQHQGKEAVFYANAITGDAPEVRYRGAVSVPRGELAMIELEIGGVAEPRRLLWYGYRIAGRATATPVAAKLYQALGAIRGRWDAQVVVASAPCDPSDCSSARQSLTSFVTAAEPLLNALVDEHSRNRT